MGSTVSLYYKLSRQYMIYAYKEDGEDYEWDGSGNKFFCKRKI